MRSAISSAFGAQMICSDVGKPVGEKPFGTANAQRPRKLAMRVKCEGMIFSFSAVASRCAVIGVVGVSNLIDLASRVSPSM